MPKPTRNSKKRTNMPSQIERFRQTARKIGCDEDEAAFERKLGKIAKPKAPTPKKKRAR